MENQAKLYLIFDMLGDMKRSGPLLWHVNRERLEDIKDHIFDIIALDKILEPYMPVHINHERIIELALVHDIEEVITGDITEFEGVSKEEKERVNKRAIDYLVQSFGKIFPFKSLFKEFEEKTTIESKICHIYDKVQCILTFAKYDSEELIDMDNPLIIEELRKLPLIENGKKEGKTLSELFYDYHIKAVNMSDEEIEKYNITRAEADSICTVIRAFVDDVVIQTKRINEIKNEFSKDASVYKH